MDALNRLVESLDWISITLFTCLLSIAVVRQLTTLSLVEFLSIYTSFRFIKITQDGRVDNYQSYQYVGIVIYSISIALIILRLSHLEEPLIFTDFILVWTAVCFFLIFKHYFSKLVSTIGNFDALLTTVDHQRNLYRAVLGFALMCVAVLIYYVFPHYISGIWITVILAGAVVLFYHILLIYSHRNLLLPSVFYFILYLCTLEITPYLLLYKYFTA